MSESPTITTPKPLNTKQKHFLERYHLTGRVGQSWLDAGYHCTPESAASNAGRVLQREDAQEYLTTLRQSIREDVEASVDIVLSRFMRILHSETARDRDVILAGREIARLLGAYPSMRRAQPDPEPNALGEFINKCRNGEIEEEKKEEPKEYEYKLTAEEEFLQTIQTRGCSLQLPYDPEIGRQIREEWAREAKEKEEKEAAEKAKAAEAQRESAEVKDSPETPGQAETKDLSETQKPAEETEPTDLTYGNNAVKNSDLWEDHFHPLYNPYYDPTLQTDSTVKAVTPLQPDPEELVMGKNPIISHHPDSNSTAPNQYLRRSLSEVGPGLHRSPVWTGRA